MESTVFSNMMETMSKLESNTSLKQEIAGLKHICIFTSIMSICSRNFSYSDDICRLDSFDYNDDTGEISVIYDAVYGYIVEFKSSIHNQNYKEIETIIIRKRDGNDGVFIKLSNVLVVVGYAIFKLINDYICTICSSVDAHGLSIEDIDDIFFDEDDGFKLIFNRFCDGYAQGVADAEYEFNRKQELKSNMINGGKVNE